MIRCTSWLAVAVLGVGALQGTEEAHTPKRSNGSVRIVAAGVPPGTLGLSLQNEVLAAVDRALDWLADQQKDDGSFSNGDFPALTALAMQAFVPSRHPRRDEVLAKGKDYLLSCRRGDGGIYKVIVNRKGGGLSNYNTAICMTVLHALRDPSLTSVILEARRFVSRSQHFGQDVFDGGFGYDRDSQRAYADLLNTYYSVQAMRLTQGLEDLRSSREERADIDWKKVLEYIERMHLRQEAGEDVGGFYYRPGESKAGQRTNEQGVVVFRAYGSITYAGAMALLYAQVPPDDPRVRSALDWAARHWTLEENPGMGQQGLYFFYCILSKALAAAEVDVIRRPDGTTISWRAELARKLVSLQKVEPDGRGYWVNSDNTFWEGDPVLTTSYALDALQRL